MIKSLSEFSGETEKKELGRIKNRIDPDRRLDLRDEPAKSFSVENRIDPDRRLEAQNKSGEGFSAEGRINPDRRLDLQDASAKGFSTESRIDPDRRLDISDGKKENSDKEADTFWKAALSQFQDESDIPSDEELLPEIFDWADDEIFIDFEVDEDFKDCLSRFDPECWENADAREQYSAIEDLKDKISERLALKKPPEIRLCEGDPDEYGSYIPEYNILLLNTRQFDDPVELVDTIAHELRHAWQHARADAMETRQDALFRVNFENYITPVSYPGIGYVNFVEYEGQYVEADARAFAKKFKEAVTQWM